MVTFSLSLALAIYLYDENWIMIQFLKLVLTAVLANINIFHNFDKTLYSTFGKGLVAYCNSYSGMPMFLFLKAAFVSLPDEGSKPAIERAIFLSHIKGKCFCRYSTIRD